MIKININNSIREFEKGLTIFEIAKRIKASYQKEALTASLNGKLVDLSTIINDDCEIKIHTFEDPEGKHVFWHTTTHMMAQATKRIFGEVKLGTGPVLENGYYYDMDLEHKISEEDLPKIEEEMNKIANEALEVKRIEVSKEEAIKILKERNEKYKLELVEKFFNKDENTNLSFYQQGEFIDLCEGPHLPNTKYVKAIKLMSIAGAYWQANSNNKMLQRVYGISYEKKKDLDNYITMLEEAKQRDHRKLGKELGLFSMKDEGIGFPFFLPKGIIIKNELMKMWREVHHKYDYKEIETPIMLNKGLWEKSGHWQHYRDNMYTLSIDEEDYAIKPMNCPGCMLAYQTDIHSYKEFPLRYAEVGRVHRYELSGALHGLMRVRAFTQDDAHIFITNDQIKFEVTNIITLIDEIYKLFGFEYHLELSTRPEEFLGDIETWNNAEKALQEAMDDLGLKYVINEGDGAFYGPKIDFHIKDCIGRTWQCGTIQLDYQLPQKFELNYIGNDGEKHRPTMLHRVAFGSLERFIGILIEHYAGKFPTWLAPVQVKVLPISDKYLEYADSIYKKLKNLGIRVELDDRAEKVGFKIRDAQMNKIPYMLIAGEKEQNDSVVSVRHRTKSDIGTFKLEEFIEIINNEIINRENN